MANSEFGQSLEKGDLNIPPDQSMTGLFCQLFYLWRPFNGRNLPDTKAVFNYRLSPARRIIENSFGILAARYKLSMTFNSNKIIPLYIYT